MEGSRIYRDIALRTDGDIYLGVVGPVRTGKSTFIKRFMETLVLPNIDNIYVRERARDELPQSGSGRTIMTAEPKFVPEDAVRIETEDGLGFSVRMVDSVGYMVDGAVGQYDGEGERMVTTPWFDHEITMREAAELGTRKVITEHSTIGVVITTDGTVTDLPRENYVEAERRVITELSELGKPFIVIVNSAHPDSEGACAVRDHIKGTYGAPCVVRNCLTLDEEDISALLGEVLMEFPVSAAEVWLPPWVDALPMEHPVKEELFKALRECGEDMKRLKDVRRCTEKLCQTGETEQVTVTELDMGTGRASLKVYLPRGKFYETLSEQSGFDVADDGDLMRLMTELSGVKKEYDKVSSALEDVRQKGYGIVYPSQDEMKLQEPEIVRQGGRYGVRLKASAPSIHMMLANIETEVSPAVSGGHSSEEIIGYLLQEFEGDTKKIWDSNMFGKSLYEIAGESLGAKIKRMPEDAQMKMKDSLQRIVNEGGNGLICIII